MSNLEPHQSLDYRTAYHTNSGGYVGHHGQSSNGPAGVSQSSTGTPSTGAQGPSSQAQPSSQTSTSSAAQQQPSLQPLHSNPQLQSQHPRGSSSMPQYQQYPSNYYSDQYQQQYQQLVNGTNQSSILSQSNQPQLATQPQPHQQPPQPVNAGAMGQYLSSMGVPQQFPYSYYMQFNQSQNQSNDMNYPYSRYSNYPPTAAAATASTSSSAAPPQNYSVYQQSIPQINNQITQPQPQHYSNVNNHGTTPAPGGETAAGYSSNYTPVPDTLNSSNNSSVGQYQPPGVRPRVTTTMWEDEKTLCYQVDANNVSVVRRADNNMINGTKLLNVAQMTRGRRDGILKSEKVRHVVKIGSMHLKGVWIPFERALAMAQREGIVDLLYPLFVRDIKRVIQTGVTPANNASAEPAAGSGTPGVTAPAAAPNNQLSTPSQSTAGTSTMNLNNYYPPYAQYPQPQAGGADPATASNQSPQQNVSDFHSSQAHQQPGQQQVYSYQQPYYAPNQYYQPYNPQSNYSSYNSQPAYPGYGYVNQQSQQSQPQAGHQQSQQLPQTQGQSGQSHSSLPQPSDPNTSSLEAGHANETSSTTDDKPKPEEKD